MTETKVCPECGGEIFLSSQVVNQQILIDGQGTHLQHVENLSIIRHAPIICATCTNEMSGLEKLVTESYFHLVICADDEKGLNQLSAEDDMEEQQILALKASIEDRE